MALKNKPKPQGFGEKISKALKGTKQKEAIERLRRHEQNDFESLKDIRQIEKEQCRVMLVMLNHMIDGNGVESMKKTRGELEKLITEIDN